MESTLTLFEIKVEKSYALSLLDADMTILTKAQIKKLQQNSSLDHDFSVFWVPRRTLLCEKVLEEAGVLGDVTSGDFELCFQPLDTDLLSLELDNSFEELYIVCLSHSLPTILLHLTTAKQHKDPTCIFASAKALMQIQQRHGLFPRILSKGVHARRLTDLLLRMRTEDSASQPLTTDSTFGNAKHLPATAEMPSSTIDSLIIIDRGVDFASPLLTQLTYEGLIDEAFTISHNQIELDPGIIGLGLPNHNSPDPPQQPQTQHQQHQDTHPTSTGSTKRRIRLDTTDSLYPTLRSANFALIGPLLNGVARRLQTSYTSRPTTQQSTQELRAFVSKLPAYQAEQQSLKLHTGLAEHLLAWTKTGTFRRSLEAQQTLLWSGGGDAGGVHEAIEDLIARNAPLETVLRLICLESCISGGLKQKDLDFFRRAVCTAYGYQHILTFHALDKCGLVSSRGGGPAFPSLPGGGVVTMGGTSKDKNDPGGPPVTNFAAAKRTLHLVLDDVSEQDPQDIAYVYSGIAPLSVRLVQCILQPAHIQSLSRSGGTLARPSAATAAARVLAAAVPRDQPSWTPFESALAQIRGPTVAETQTSRERSTRARQTLEGRGGRRTSFVFFLGGVTVAEVAALRFVREGLGEGRGLCVGCTGIIGGGRMIGAAMASGSREVVVEGRTT